jgi:hypothetical protein
VGSLAVIERLRLRRLCWGDNGHVCSLVNEFGGFDIILGADVVYVEESVPALFASIAQLLRPPSEVSPSLMGTILCCPACVLAKS